MPLRHLALWLTVGAICWAVLLSPLYFYFFGA